MLSEVQIEAILANDMVLWNSYTEKFEEPASQRVRARLKDGIMPDGKPCIGSLEGRPMQMVQMWCQFVRGEFDARKDRQEAESLKRAEAHAGSGGEEAQSPGVDGARPSSTTGDLSAPQDGVEGVLESKVAALDRHVAALKEARETAFERFRVLDESYGAAINERDLTIAALNFVRTRRNGNEGNPIGAIVELGRDAREHGVTETVELPDERRVHGGGTPAL